MSSEQETSNVTKLPTGGPAGEEAGEETRRIHLRDITADTPLDGDAIGIVLRKTRLKTGEDLKSVSDKLRIRRPYLEALEESRHDDLPGRPYAIGFIRTYATYLGIDVSAAVESYKAETAPEDEAAVSAAEQFSFPEVREEARIPKGSLLILAVLLGAGIYGAWLLSISADRMVTERVPPVPERLGENVEVVASEAGDEVVASGEIAPTTALTGDSASAAADTGALPEVNEPIRSVPTQGENVAPIAADPASETVSTETSSEENGVASEVDVAAVTPVTPPLDEPSVTIADDLALAVGGARVYGLENEGARVIVRATKQAWLRIEAGDGSVLLNQTLTEGEMYRAPLDSGAILVARDAGAFEIFIDGKATGAAGPSGLVLTGKSLNAEDLLGR
jgi:cytoskeleton protein RodZ